MQGAASRYSAVTAGRILAATRRIDSSDAGGVRFEASFRSASERSFAGDGDGEWRYIARYREILYSSPQQISASSKITVPIGRRVRRAGMR